ncbi:MAG: M23 family metallopeptidase [Candidatus Obscuribacterales bacterium]|nr:M23 family metallopeptidase [Candidatus Obscuribacterales bacterium]
MNYQIRPALPFISKSLFFLYLAAFLQPASAAMQLELPAVAKQGECIRLILRDDSLPASGDGAAGGAALPVVQFRDKSYKIFPLPRPDASADGFVGRALIGIPADLEPGNYKVRVADKEQNVKVLAGNFPVQVMRLPKGKDNFNASPGEEDTVKAAKETVSSRQYWDGKFLRPSSARVSSGFGLRRRVNGKLLKDYFHSGIDFAGGLGSPVAACQSGKVLIAHQGWKLHGNTICIDHGQGVLSFYIHLSKILVKEGDIVKAGQKIGAIGSTGRASGPHLHFSLYVNNDATSPFDWFTKVF